MKFTVTYNVFKYTWDQVAIGLWRRYPNPNSTHVLTEDVLSREIDGDKLVSVRLVTKTNKIPKWGERFVKDKQILIVEESVVDKKQKTLTTYTRNIGHQKIMTVEEKCVYTSSPDNPSWTVCEKSFWISSSVFGFSRAIEMFGVERFKRNAKNATEGFDYVLTGLFKPDLLKDHPLNFSHKIRDTARKAAELAKSKAPPILGSASASS